MSFEIVDINAVESTSEAELENNIPSNNEFEIIDLTVYDSVEQIYLGNLNTNSSEFQIYDLEVDNAVEYYYSNTGGGGTTITEILYTVNTNGPNLDSPYFFVKEDNIPYIDAEQFISNPNSYPQVFKIPEGAIIQNITFVNLNAPQPPGSWASNIINFNLNLQTNVLFNGTLDIDSFNNPINAQNIPLINNQNYYFFWVSTSNFLLPNQIQMTITYTV